jgi:hypothetical protein
MAALTAMTARQTRNDSLASYATYTCTTGTTIYEGSLVMVTLATGLALPGADTASCGFVGIATNTVVSAAAGATINVKFGHEELLGAASSLAAVTGAACVISRSARSCSPSAPPLRGSRSAARRPSDRALSANDLQEIPNG